MTRLEFIQRLLEIFGEDTVDVFSNGLENGWLEFEDKLYRDDEINRKNIARIIHECERIICKRRISMV